MPQPSAFTRMSFWSISSRWLRDLVATSVLDYPLPNKGPLFYIFFEPSNSVMPQLVLFTITVFWSICSQWLRDLVAPSVVDHPPPNKSPLLHIFLNQAVL